MKTKVVLTGMAGLALTACGPSAAERPNVIYVFPDQYRNSSLGFWSDPEFASQVAWQGDPVSTPNLDRFAREAVVLSEAVSNFPVSSPHRGMLLSGMYPERNGVVLTGGGASLVNIGQMLKEMSGYTVRTGYPRTQIFSSGGCPGAAEASAAASIGMILEASRDSHLNCIEEAEAATDAESASAPAQAATEETTAPDNGTFFNDDELREITENYSEAVRNNDTEKMITFDERFHKKIVASSGNKTLIQLSETVQELALRFRYLYYDDFSRYVNMPVEHKEIIDALTSGNGDMARQSADDHVKKLKEFVINEGDRAFR